MELGRQIAIARRWLPLLLAGAVLAAVPAFLYGRSRTPEYEATTRLMVTTGANARPDDLAVAIHRAGDYGTLAGTREFAQAVLDDLGLQESVASFQRRVSVTAAANTALLAITARDRDPAEAARIANATGEILKQQSLTTGGEGLATAVAARLSALDSQIEETSERIQELASAGELTEAEQVELADLRALLSGLLGDYAQYLSLSTTLAAGRLTTIEAAVAPGSEAGIGTLVLTLLASLAGLFLASAIAFVLAWRRDSLYGAQDIVDVMELPDLGLVEERTGDAGRGGVARLMAGRSPRVAATYRSIRGAITLATAEVSAPSILVCSTFKEKTAVAAHIALSYARSGRRVLLIDADFARPSLHTLLGTGNNFGLSTILELAAEPPRETLGSPTSFPGLWFLSSGPADSAAAEYLESPRMREFLIAAKSAYDAIVVEGPPILGASDSVVLAATMDATILVVDQDGSRRAPLEAVRHRLLTAQARPIGIVRYRRTRWASSATASAAAQAVPTERTSPPGTIERPGRP